MTIAIGILLSDGILIAADREESSGYEKLDQGKVTGAWRASPPGTILMSGAGAGSNIDTLSANVKRWFKDDDESDHSKIAAHIEATHAHFYDQKVLPFATSDIGRADYSLLIGCWTRPNGNMFPERSIWTTDGLTLVQHAQYAAVGVGSATARAILSKLFLPLSTVEAVNLAAYVIHEVKLTISGCGIGTDIVYTHKDFFNFVPVEQIKEMEEGFKLYRKEERIHFHQCMSHNTDASPVSKALIERDSACRSKIQEAFKQLNDRRSKGQP
jgi:20S proteasome alpha/beta subunit